MDTEREELARQVAGLIGEVGIEFFRNAVRQVAAERVAALDEKQRREEARREVLRKTGVWRGHRGHKLRGRPGPGWCHWVETFRGTLTLKKRLSFKMLKAQGFPSDSAGNKAYAVEVEGWIPEELSPYGDPPTYDLLPLPNRGLTKPEKVAVLSAIHDAHRKNDEKVAPWGVSRNGDWPAANPPGADRAECSRATWYHIRVREAKAVTAADLSTVRDWLEGIRSTPKPAEPPAAKTKPGEEAGRQDGKPKTPKRRRKRSDPKADAQIADAYNTGHYRTEAELATALGKTETEVHRARDRHRKREEAKARVRKKPRQ